MRIIPPLARVVTSVRRSSLASPSLQRNQCSSRSEIGFIRQLICQNRRSRPSRSRRFFSPEVETMHCNQCGVEMVPGTAFCASCGQPAVWSLRSLEAPRSQLRGCRRTWRGRSAISQDSLPRSSSWSWNPTATTASFASTPFNRSFSVSPGLLCILRWEFSNPCCPGPCFTSWRHSRFLFRWRSLALLFG